MTTPPGPGERPEQRFAPPNSSGSATPEGTAPPPGPPGPPSSGGSGDSRGGWFAPPERSGTPGAGMPPAYTTSPPPPPPPTSPPLPGGPPSGNPPQPGGPPQPSDPHSPGGPPPGGAYAGYAADTYYAPGTGPQPPAVKLDPLSVASVPGGLIGPVGVGLGIAGIVRTKGGRRRGRPLAWTGTALGTVVTLGGAAVGIVLAVTAAEWKTLPADVTEPTTANAVQVSVGNCIDQLPADGADVTGINVVPCADEHHAQVVASTTLPDGAFPGTDQVTERTSRACPASVLGDDPPAGVERVVWTPTKDSWAQGDRTGLCLVWGQLPLTEDYAD